MRTVTEHGYAWMIPQRKKRWRTTERRRKKKGLTRFKCPLHTDVDTYHILNVGFDVVDFDII